MTRRWISATRSATSGGCHEAPDMLGSTTSRRVLRGPGSRNYCRSDAIAGAERMSSIPESGATWSTWPEARAIVRQNLRRTITIALVVGSILFVINQLDVVLSGKATIVVWLKI